MFWKLNKKNPIRQLLNQQVVFGMENIIYWSAFNTVPRRYPILGNRWLKINAVNENHRDRSTG
jgi:hypothetical protein